MKQCGSAASSLSIEKRINGDDADTAPGVTVVPGSPMTVEFLVTNTGESELTDVTVTDNVIPAASIVAPTTKTLAGGGTADFAGSLLPGESAVYTAGIIAAAICGVFLISGGSMILSLFMILVFERQQYRRGDE